MDLCVHLFCEMVFASFCFVIELLFEKVASKDTVSRLLSRLYCLIFCFLYYILDLCSSIEP